MSEIINNTEMNDSMEPTNASIKSAHLNTSNKYINKTKSLGDRMKDYEYSVDYRISYNYYYTVRLDGSSFSNYCKPLRKPFDTNFIKSMAFVQKDLMCKFSALTSYSHSDEITLVFDKVTLPAKTHYSGGRIQKIISHMASYCSARFNHHMNVLCDLDLSCKYKDYIHNNIAFFDARVAIFTEPYEIVNYILWRSVYDCEKNAISTYAKQYYSNKELYRKHSEKRKAMLLTKGIDWTTVPTYIKHGIFCKKQLYEIGDETKTIRSKYVFKQFKIECQDANIDSIMNKTWNDTMYDSIEYNIDIFD